MTRSISVAMATDSRPSSPVTMGVASFADGRDKLLQFQTKGFDLAGVRLDMNDGHLSPEEFLLLGGQRSHVSAEKLSGAGGELVVC